MIKQLKTILGRYVKKKKIVTEIPERAITNETDNYDISTEDEVFTFPFIDGKSLSEIYADVEIQPC